MPEQNRVQDNIIVRGRVMDANGNGLTGVSVTLQGTRTGTTTDANGGYSISVSKTATLVFTYVGFVPKEIPVNGQQVIDVSLVDESTALEEVVVTALGIERQTRSLTYSTQRVSTEQMTKAREPNIMNSLQGKVAGLSINSSASGVGASARVVLRGNKSISGDSQPLYVVDGVPIRGNPDNLNADNVESINILKGPNAAALYGSAAQNGAIVIETKRGKAGVTRVGVSQTFMIQQPIILTDFQNEYGQGQGGLYDRTSEYSWGPRMEGQTVEHWSLDPAMAGATYALTPQPDNNIDAYQNGHNATTNVYATIGGERTQTMFSYTLTDAAGILPGNELKRHNVSARMNNQLAKGLTLDVKADYIYQKIANGYFGGRYNPTRMIYRLPRNIQTAHLRDFEYTDAEGLNKQNYFNPGSAIGGNPYWILNRTPNDTERERIIALTSLSYQFSDHLKLMVRGSYDGANGGREEKLYNDNYASAPDGQYNVESNRESEFNADFLASFNKQFATDWNVDLSVGGNIKIQRNSAVRVSTGQAMIIPNFFALSNTNLPVVTHNPGLNQDIYSLYAFGQLSWKSAVFLDVTGRNDWSSTLPADNRSYFYPSVGLSAVLSDLMEFPEAISMARIRGSWAEVGNSANPYMVRRTASFSAGGTNGFLQLSNTLPNTNLRPERTRSTEIGLDLRFFQNRLGFDITAYKTNTYDQLFTVALPVGSGAREYYTNGGDVENKGIEALITTTPVKQNDFSWDLNLNFGLNRNMVNRISDERPRVNLTPSGFFSNFIIEEGQPFGNIYSRGFIRDEQGRVIVGANGLPKVTSGITVLVANFNPDWTGGISNTLRYKNFGLSFLIEHRQGGTVASETNAILYDDGVTEQTLIGRNGDLVFGQHVFTDEVAVLEDGSPNNIAISAESFWRSIGGRSIPVGEAFVDDATNTRLRELTLDYTLPSALFNKWPISNVQLSLVGRNLFFLYRASDHLDPDFMGGTGASSEGTQAFTPASSRSFGFSLKVDF
ncbi:SusC/RagA family TonB-linked outer membrane protein [Parapedobacter lycopersici]|uniref:SusC/RagA family TonB-linked outer membrane protein n=1 Tax=Parapedobacter lycopersici TaxID=1864939 RepID=UPI003340DADD